MASISELYTQTCSASSDTYALYSIETMDKESDISNQIMVDNLLVRMDSLLADEEPIANVRDAAVFVDDALLRLKLWREELQRKCPKALDIIRTEGPRLHQIITRQLENLHITLNSLEEACRIKIVDDGVHKLKFVRRMHSM
jgi:hypothetical protein